MKIATFTLSTAIMLAASANIGAADKFVSQELTMHLLFPDGGNTTDTDMSDSEQMYVETCAKEAHNKYFGRVAGEFDIDMMEVLEAEAFYLEDSDDVDEDGDEDEFDEDEDMGIDDFDEEYGYDDKNSNHDERNLGLRHRIKNRWKNRRRWIKRRQPKRPTPPPPPTPAPTYHPRDRPTAAPTVSPKHKYFRDRFEYNTFWAHYEDYGKPTGWKLKDFVEHTWPMYRRNFALATGKCVEPCPEYPEPKKKRHLKKKKNKKNKKPKKSERKLQKKANDMFCNCISGSPFPGLKGVLACKLDFEDAMSLGDIKMDDSDE